MNWLWTSWCDYGYSEFTTTVIGRLTVFIDGHHHITIAITLITVMLDVLRLCSSDRVFKSLVKSENFHFSLNWEVMLLQDKTSTQIWVLPRKCMKWHKISLQKWFINLPSLEHCLSSSNCSSSIIKINSPKSELMYQKPPFIQK